jgi:hypothetical protein
MKLKIDKKWFAQKAAEEGDCEIGAGNPNFMKENRPIIMDDEDAYLAMVTKPEPPKVVVDKIKKSFSKCMDGNGGWDWSIIVWKHANFLASFTINSTVTCESQKIAEIKMNETLKFLNIVQKPMTK